MSTLRSIGDPAHNILRHGANPLDVFFSPKRVAVIGATEKTGSVGRTILWNLIHTSFGGVVFPVNPARSSILGIKAYTDIASVPEPVDLAVIVTPASTVPGVISECVEAGVQGAVIISAGFKEAGTTGAELEQKILEQARKGDMRIIGPNCLGIMIPNTGLNATFAHAMARPGNVGFISQSGALCTAILDWSFKEHLGFSAFLSVGSMLDVGWGDLIYYLGDDPRTNSILIYMESIGDARSFLSAAREVALTKPIIVIKAGRTDAAAKAAASHTGTLAGSDDVLDAAFRRSGVLRVNSISDLFYMAEALAKQPRPKGPRLTILTNAGGPAVLATDALITSGGKLAKLSSETMDALNKLLPPHWSRNNPIDVLGDAGEDRYLQAFEIAAKDPNSDGLLIILTPQAMTDPTKTAEKLLARAKVAGKPVLASWMGGSLVSAGEAVLSRGGVPTFPYPDTAAKVFEYMWQYSDNLHGLYETPASIIEADLSICDHSSANEIINSVRKAGRTILSEIESKKLLSTYCIPTVETYLAETEEEALEHAERIGYPVVLKLHSETITHKTDVGGVQLNLANKSAVRTAWKTIERSVHGKAGAEHFLGVTVQPMIKLDGYEIIVGSSMDIQFGPVLLFGLGGQLVEVFKDRALALPPLNTTLARRMMERTRIFHALKGIRGRKRIDFAALEQILVCFSQLVAEQRWIKEIDINPLLVSSSRIVALDARVILHEPAMLEKELPKLAIRPYPVQYVTQWTMKNGRSINIRPIRPEDEPLIVKFHETLSEKSVYYRYFQTMKLTDRVAHERLTRICFIDYDREMALVAEENNPVNGKRRILGVGRLSKLHNSNDAEVAILITDELQGHGLGTELLRRLIEVGRNEGLYRVVAYILPDNKNMQRLCEKLNFQLHHLIEASVVRAELELGTLLPV